MPIYSSLINKDIDLAIGKRFLSSFASKVNTK